MTMWLVVKCERKRFVCSGSLVFLWVRGQLQAKRGFWNLPQCGIIMFTTCIQRVTEFLSLLCRNLIRDGLPSTHQSQLFSPVERSTMAVGPNVSLTAWRATATVLHTLGIGCTSFRVYHRHRKRRAWWDDHWALLSALCDTVYAVTPWIRRDNRGLAQPTTESVHQGIIIFWLTATLFPIVVWTARISIGLSITRLVPPKTRERKYLYALNIWFGLMWLALVIQKLWVCCRDTSWHRNRAVQCYLGNGVGILSLCLDITADTCLVFIPLHMLWRVKLPRTQRRLILSVFASSILSSLAGVVYAVFVFCAQISRSTNWSHAIGLSANIKAAVTLFVCNLLVVVTYLYCLFWKDEDEDVSEPSETRSKPSQAVPEPTAIALTQFSDVQFVDTSAYASRYFERSQYTGPPVSSSQSTFSPKSPPSCSRLTTHGD
ncbi:hypothetical protein BDZ94DRAFT_808821 [Collybia nuda]|uniref:Rhodopsin domain-containing protein n=1 Tax=Collybia nuda TaxID=64659 RepID=A0A9P5Y2I5_9AGAR|nr:hypothetical protein BDZ94DRAFT_808821 [Collybia nuda]